MSLGLTLAKAFEGAAVGTLGAAKERDKRVKEETDKRDILFQKALAYAEKDRDKYDAAVLSSRERLNLANAELGTMIADSNERRLVAASMAKKYTDKTSLQEALKRYQGSFTKDNVNVFEGLDLSTVDIESFKDISSEDLAKALVPTSLLPKGIESYYKPSAFKDESILFGGLGQPQALKAQQEQYASLAEASGLNITAPEGEIPVVSLPAPKQPLNIENYKQRVFRAQTILDNITDVDSDEYRKAKANLKKATEAHMIFEASGRAPTSGGSILGLSVAGTLSGISERAKDPRTVFSSSPAVIGYYSMENAQSEYSLQAITTAKKEMAFKYYANIKPGFDDKSKSRQEFVAYEVGIERAPENGSRPSGLDKALSIRGGDPSTTLDSVLGNIINIKQDSEAFTKLPMAQKALISAIKAGKVAQTPEAKDKAENNINAALVNILSNGFFLTVNTESMNYTKLKDNLIAGKP